MSEEPEILIIHSDSEGSKSLVEQLSRIETVEPRAVGKKSLAGSPEAWMVLVGVTIRTLPLILQAIARIQETRPVPKIKIGDFEYINPTRADLDKLLKSYLKRNPPPRD